VQSPFWSKPLTGWKPLRFEAEDFLAIVLQHEIDHLNGMLFIDRISKLKRELYSKRVLKQLRRNQ